jgi:hypothetical protein
MKSISASIVDIVVVNIQQRQAHKKHDLCIITTDKLLAVPKRERTTPYKKLVPFSRPYITHTRPWRIQSHSFLKKFGKQCTL